MANAVKVFGNQNQGVVLAQALKEWAIAIQSLHSGDLVLLLRKGGLRDPIQPFTGIPAQAALFPTYEHQVPGHLKDPGAVLSSEVDAPIQINTWAHITHRFSLQSQAEIEALMPFHIWTEAFIVERLKWRSQQPIQALLLRAYRLPASVALGRSAASAGCRSWIDLDRPIGTQGSVPVLAEPDYHTRLMAIECAIRSVKDSFRLEAVQLL